MPNSDPKPAFFKTPPRCATFTVKVKARALQTIPKYKIKKQSENSAKADFDACRMNKLERINHVE
jgi:hypothetical protein